MGKECTKFVIDFVRGSVSGRCACVTLGLGFEERTCHFHNFFACFEFSRLPSSTSEFVEGDMVMIVGKFFPAPVAGEHIEVMDREKNTVVAEIEDTQTCDNISVKRMFFKSLIASDAVIVVDDQFSDIEHGGVG